MLLIFVTHHVATSIRESQNAGDNAHHQVADRERQKVYDCEDAPYRAIGILACPKDTAINFVALKMLTHTFKEPLFFASDVINSAPPP